VEWKPGDVGSSIEVADEDVCRVLARTAEVSEGVSAVFGEGTVSKFRGIEVSSSQRDGGLVEGLVTSHLLYLFNGL